MIELTRCGAPDNDRYLPAVMTQGDASTYQTCLLYTSDAADEL